jgi:hypothetical protein
MACPATRKDLTLDVHECDGEEIVTGILRRGGVPHPPVVPRMKLEMDELESVKRAVSYDWKAHHSGRVEQKECLAVPITRIGSCGQLHGSDRSSRRGHHGAEWRMRIRAIHPANRRALCTNVSRRRHKRSTADTHHVETCRICLSFKRISVGLQSSAGELSSCGRVGLDITLLMRPGAAAKLACQVRPAGRLYLWVCDRRCNRCRFVKDIFDLLRI